MLILENLEIDFGEDHQESDPHIVRIGWSMDSTSFQLGTMVHFVYVEVEKPYIMIAGSSNINFST